MKFVSYFFRYSVLILIMVLMMAPLVTVALASMRTTGEFLTAPFGLPLNGIHWEHFTDILANPSFWASMKNSLIITISVTILVLICSSMMAFAFARISFVGRDLIFNLVTIGMLFPLAVAILPVFIQIRQLGLTNNYLGVILPVTAFNLPYTTVILRGFFRAIPKELEDASYIDGCSIFGFFWHILLPLARPSIMSVATLTIVAAWNEYFLPLLILNDSKMWPLPLGMMQFQGQFGTDWSRIMAYVVLLIIPALIFYVFTEKYITTGLTGGELKG